MPQGASIGSTTPPSDESLPQGVQELSDMGLLPDKIEGEDTTNFIEGINDGFYGLPCMEDEHGRKIIQFIEGVSPDDIEGEDTTESFDWSEMDDEFYYFLPCMEDEHGRKIIQLKGEKLHPSSDASDICNDAFKKIVDPIGFCHLSDEYMNIYWEEFKKKANTGSYDQDLYKKAFVKKCKGRYFKYINNLKRRKNKPAYFTNVMWKAYTDAWKMLEAAGGCSANCEQEQEKAHSSHSNDSVSYAGTTETMSEKSDGKRPAYFDLPNMTRKRAKKNSLEICPNCTVMAAQIRDMVSAGVLQLPGIENASDITSSASVGPVDNDSPASVGTPDIDPITYNEIAERLIGEKVEKLKNEMRLSSKLQVDECVAKVKAKLDQEMAATKEKIQQMKSLIEQYQQMKRQID
ncbi:uncharacterized protein LOC125193536 isoform X2 [Salvia hispanica]|nr:uncharacterized protein LOC125193536 isoform X2 [Salvia hispanica]